MLTLRSIRGIYPHPIFFTDPRLVPSDGTPRGNLVTYTTPHHALTQQHLHMNKIQPEEDIYIG